MITTRTKRIRAPMYTLEKIKEFRIATDSTQDSRSSVDMHEVCLMKFEFQKAKAESIIEETVLLERLLASLLQVAITEQILDALIFQYGHDRTPNQI